MSETKSFCAGSNCKESVLFPLVMNKKTWQMNPKMLILAITTGQGRHVITSYNRACDRSLLYFLAGMTMVAYLVCPIQMLDVCCAFF